MADKEINNQKDFFQEIVLNENGELQVTLVARQGEFTSPEDAETFFKLIAIDENGHIKVTQ